MLTKAVQDDQIEELRDALADAKAQLVEVLPHDQPLAVESNFTSSSHT
jgi:hypothetical protein